MVEPFLGQQLLVRPCFSHRSTVQNEDSVSVAHR